MRILVALADGNGLAYWKVADRAVYLLAIFSCCQTSMFSSIGQNKNRMLVLRDRAEAAHTALAATVGSRGLRRIAIRAAAATARAKDAADAATAAINAAESSWEHYAALKDDVTLVQRRPLKRVVTYSGYVEDASSLHARPLWPEGVEADLNVRLRAVNLLEADASRLDAGFEVWLDWYHDRIEGKGFDFDIERKCASLSQRQRHRSPLEVNTHLARLRGSLVRPLSFMGDAPSGGVRAGIPRASVRASRRLPLGSKKIKKVNAQRPPAMKVFISYARDDSQKVEDVYRLLKNAGHQPWMDVYDITPGEAWPRAITKAIEGCDAFVACLSTKSVDRCGWVQKELLKAMDVLGGMLPNDIFIIPLRLESCPYPERLSTLHGLDWFGRDGPSRLLKALEKSAQRRN